MDTAYVERWLSLIPTPIKSERTLEKPESHPRKRQRGLISPPMSTEEHQSISPKRRKRDDGSTDENQQAGNERWMQDTTPRPARSLRLNDTAVSIASSSSIHTGGTSRSSSPRKQLTGLRSLPLGQGGAEVCTLDIEDTRMPVELVDLVLSLQSRNPVISLHQRNTIQEHYKSTRAARQWADASLFGLERDAIGPTPEPDFVDDIVQQARECDRYLLDEAAWSSMVYYPLLRQIFKSRRDSQLDDLVVVPCSSASIIPRYRMVATPFKKVDFAIAYQPRNPTDSDHLKVIMQDTPMPDQTLNHTSYPGLCDRPIVLSIEVKRTNDSADTAKLQLLTWLSSQWNKMDELSPAATDTEFQADRPTYLLSLLIQGHDWSLVASSRDAGSKRIILWHKLPLGDTQTAMGVYKIVQQVQQLAQLALAPYCQWFQGLG